MSVQVCVRVTCACVSVSSDTGLSPFDAPTRIRRIRAFVICVFRGRGEKKTRFREGRESRAGRLRGSSSTSRAYAKSNRCLVISLFLLLPFFPFLFAVLLFLLFSFDGRIIFWRGFCCAAKVQRAARSKSETSNAPMR